MKSISERLIKAIKSNRFNYEKYLNGGMWYGHELHTMPLLCFYGQIGFCATIDNEVKICYDWEFKKIMYEIAIFND